MLRPVKDWAHTGRLVESHWITLLRVATTRRGGVPIRGIIFSRPFVHYYQAVQLRCQAAILLTFA